MPCILTAPVVTKAPAERTSAQGKEPGLLFFDCDQATEPSSTGCGRETGERPTGLRSYGLGGVEGAAFNAQLLRCRVGLVTPCDGRAEVRVYVGNRLLERFRNVPLTEGTVCDTSIQMERLLDELDPLLDRPYNTAILSTNSPCPLFGTFCQLSVRFFLSRANSELCVWVGRDELVG